ncbi:hypothetical protein E3P92_00926 [Wallemia ichthyophaga]|uniref:Asl1-like glycosyl hydrolase catalytic domain-containing protein n=1 Tax=Wallemia ichthyophaga TaxID=245174 RepID=A0A4T0J7C0_WALIC|nr:hypothetical protein E3P92_00926 [Wallemia ichthyophaga]TIB38037.1 hypothetical protein E3P86_01879 [Wallemia ichthyophaga]
MHSKILLATLALVSTTLAGNHNGDFAARRRHHVGKRDWHHHGDHHGDHHGNHHGDHQGHHHREDHHGHHWDHDWDNQNGGSQDNSSGDSTATTTSSWSAPSATTSSTPSSNTGGAVTTSTNSPAASPTTTSSGNSDSTTSGTEKAGLAWPNGNANDISKWSKGNIGWYYTWSPWPVDSAGDLDFYPQLWGQKQVSTWNQQKSKFAEWGTTHILGFNEPNEVGQANMNPADAASLWNQEIAQYQGQYTLISPACTSRVGDSASGSDGIKWLQEFQQNGASFDAVAVHIYDTDYESVISTLQKFHDTFQLPVYLTEYACQNFAGGAQCSESEVWQMMEKTSSWMDEQEWMHGYSWFGVMENMQGVNQLNQLLSNDSPTELGSYYIQSS